MIISSSEEGKAELQSWIEEAKGKKTEDLFLFIDKLINQYSHDQHSVVMACVSSCLAVVSSFHRSEEGPFNTSQNHAVLEQFIRNFLVESGPMKITNWLAMLNSEAKHAFTTIPADVFALMRASANDFLAGDMEGVSEEQKKHLEQISNGVVPFGYKIEGQE